MANETATPPLDVNFRIRTPRLELRYLDPDSPAQCEYMFELVNSPEFLAGNGSTAIPTPDVETLQRLLRRDIPQLVQTGFGRYAVSLKSDGPPTEDAKSAPESETFIGTVTMKLRQNPGAPTIPDIGFQLLRRFWGKGYATEAAEALLKYFKEEKAIHGFAGYCETDNVQSQKMLQRLGFENRGVRPIRITGDGLADEAMVWTKGVEGELEKYGI